MDFRNFLQTIAAQQGWSMAYSADGGAKVEVPTIAGRTQVVDVTPGADPEGRPMLFFWSVAADLNAVGDPWYLLQLNAQYSYGALAVSNNQIIIIDTQLLATADAEEVARAIYYIAKNADELEMQAYGHQDRH